jgi:hypothetical protein
MDINQKDGYVLVDANDNVVSYLSRSSVEDRSKPLVPFKGMRIVSIASRDISHLEDLFDPSLWTPD